MAATEIVPRPGGIAIAGGLVLPAPLGRQGELGDRGAARGEFCLGVSNLLSRLRWTEGPIRRCSHLRRGVRRVLVNPRREYDAFAQGRVRPRPGEPRGSVDTGDGPVLL